MTDSPILEELRRVVRPLLTAMELIGGWVYSPVKRGIAYIFKNIYSLCIIGFSLWPLIKIFFSIDAKTQLGYDLFLHLTLSALFLAGFINAYMAYTRYTAEPIFFNLVVEYTWACAHTYKKNYHILIRLAIVVMVLLTTINNFAWLAFNVHELQSVSIKFAKPFDKSDVAVWATLLVISFLTLPVFYHFYLVEFSMFLLGGFYTNHSKNFPTPWPSKLLMSVSLIIWTYTKSIILNSQD